MKILSGNSTHISSLVADLSNFNADNNVTLTDLKPLSRRKFIGAGMATGAVLSSVATVGCATYLPIKKILIS